MQDYIDKCNAIIAEHGMMVQGVTGEAVLCYSVGLSREAPGVEIFIVGVPFDYARQMLNAIRRQYLQGTVKLLPDEILGEIADGFVVQLKPIDASQAYPFHVAEAVLGTKPTFLRVAYPDQDGVFPWEDGCDEVVVKLNSAEFLAGFE